MQEVEIQGQLDGRFWRVAQAMQRTLRQRGGGGAVCVYHRGRKVVDLWGGVRDERSNPWRENTMAMCFSTSKGVISTLIHILADRGMLSYGDRVSRHWPEFGQQGKRAITVRDLLTHRAGLHDVRNLVTEGEQILDWDHMVSALEGAEASPPGRDRSAYHALTFGWLVGELVQRVTGRPLQNVIHEELVGPLGLDGFFIGTPRREQRRAARLLGRPGKNLPRFAKTLLSEAVAHSLGRVNGVLRIPFDPRYALAALSPPDNGDVLFHPRILDGPVPAANGLFTARSLARMYGALAEGGSLDGVDLFSRRTLRRISKVEVAGRDHVLPIRMHWRLGYHSAFSTRGRIASAFGHFGFGGSGAWADPERRLSVAFVNNCIGGSPFGDRRIAAIGAAALRSVSQRPERSLRPVPALTAVQAL